MVEQILETLALLIVLGSVLARIRFLGEPFIADLNKLAFWIALSALIFTSASSGSGAAGHLWQIFGVMAAGTFLITPMAWATSYALRMAANTRGTQAQSAFRGNLAYIGVPVPANSFGVATPALSAGIIAMALTMALYNILAEIVLLASQHSVSSANWQKMALSHRDESASARGPARLDRPTAQPQAAAVSRRYPAIARRRSRAHRATLHRRLARGGALGDTLSRAPLAHAPRLEDRLAQHFGK